MPRKKYLVLVNQLKIKKQLSNFRKSLPCILMSIRYSNNDPRQINFTLLFQQDISELAINKVALPSLGQLVAYMNTKPINSKNLVIKCCLNEKPRTTNHFTLWSSLNLLVALSSKL